MENLVCDQILYKLDWILKFVNYRNQALEMKVFIELQWINLHLEANNQGILDLLKLILANSDLVTQEVVARLINVTINHLSAQVEAV